MRGIFSLVYLFSFLSPSLEDGPIKSEILSQRAVRPKTTNQPNPFVGGMRTPVYSCYHVYSKVSDKNACRSIDSDLTTHSTILDSNLRRFFRTAFSLVVFQRVNWLCFFGFFSTAPSISFRFHPAFSLLAFCEQTM